MEESLKFVESSLYAENVFVIGGANLYEEAFHHKNCQQVFLTRIGIPFESDVFVNKKSIEDNFIPAETSMTFSEN